MDSRTIKTDTTIETTKTFETKAEAVAHVVKMLQGTATYVWFTDRDYMTPPEFEVLTKQKANG